MVDASAAIGILTRRGLGKMRHVQVQDLWCQEVNATGRAHFRKVDGKWNPADLMTEALDEKTVLRHTWLMRMQFRAGRAATAPELT